MCQVRIVPNDALQHAFFKRPSGDMAPAVSAQAIADSASQGLNYAQQIAPQLMGALVDPAAASALSAQTTSSLVNDLLALTQHSQVTGNSSSNSAQAINSNQFVSANNSSGNYIDNNYFVSSQSQMHQVGNAGTNGGSNDASNSSESSFLLGFYWGC